MSLLQLVRVSVGQVGVQPGEVKMLASDNLATITAAGYLNGAGLQLQEVNLSPLDVIDCMYSYDSVLGTASYVVLTVSISNGVITLVEDVSQGDVLLPVVSGNFAVFNGTTGQIKDAGYLPSNAAKTVVVMAGSAVVANHMALFQDTTGTVDDTAATAINNGSVQAGLSGTAGTLISFPSTAARGALILAAVANAGNTNTTISNASMGQASVISIPDPGASTANFLLDAGTNAAGTFTVANIVNLKYGATPVAQVDPASCTISAVAGAANTATITVQLKDGSGSNIARIIPFRVYASSAADGLTLASAASTGFSVASGGLSLQNGAAITTQISAMSSASGACVLSLLDTGKQTSYLVLVLANGCKISAQLSAGSYGA
jgi:hypothetical protein